MRGAGHYACKYLFRVLVAKRNGFHSYCVCGAGNVAIIVRTSLVGKCILGNLGSLLFTIDFIDSGEKCILKISILEVFQHFNIVIFVCIVLVEDNIRGPDYFAVA